MFKPSMLTDVQTPFLGTPLVPLTTTTTTTNDNDNTDNNDKQPAGSGRPHQGGSQGQDSLSCMLRAVISPTE